MKTHAWHRYLRFWSADVEDDVDAELHFHLEMREHEYIAAGLAPDEAHAEATRRFGSFTGARDECCRIGHKWERHARRSDLLRSVGNDAIFALRQLSRNRIFTSAAVITLALGIGANTLVLSLVNAVVLRPLPGVAEPNRVFSVPEQAVSYPSYTDFRNSSPALSGLAVYGDRSTAVSDGSRTEIASVGAVSGNFFRVLGVKSLRGRLLTDRDDDPAAAPAAVLSAKFARRFFPTGSSIVGHSILLNGMPVTIVGIAAEDFQGLQIDSPEQIWITAQAWITLAPSTYKGLTLQRRSWSWLNMIGRLAPRGTIEQARAAFKLSASRQEAALPERSRGLAQAMAATPLIPIGQTALSVEHSTVIKATTIVMTVVTIVLLIACANVCNLLLARAIERRREIGVRVALGARRGRIVRQLLTETSVLALMSAAGALVVTQFGLRLVSRLSITDGFSIGALGLRIDLRTIAGAILVALITGMLIGALPALQMARKDVTGALKDGTTGAGHARSGALRALLVAQVSLSLVLLVGAGLFIRSLQHALATDPGFDASHVAVATINVGVIRSDSSRAAQLYDAVNEELRRLPGVTAAATATSIPLTGAYEFSNYVPPEGRAVSVEVSDVSPQYFRVFSIPLTRGRAFNDRDAANTPHVAIINETMAHRYWSRAQPLGARILLGRDTVTIVGVARDIKYHELREAPMPYVYRALDQHISGAGVAPVNVVVRSTGNTGAAIGAIRRAMHDIAPEVPVYDEATFDERTGNTIFAQRLGATVLGIFGSLALVITVIGVYGVVSYRVTQRTREIGIRVALGAPAGSVLRLVLVENLSVIGIGIVLGLALSAALTRTVSGFLFGVGALDGFTFAGAALLLLVVGSAAALIPALRAMRVDPVIALRSE